MTGDIETLRNAANNHKSIENEPTPKFKDNPNLLQSIDSVKRNSPGTIKRAYGTLDLDSKTV